MTGASISSVAPAAVTQGSEYDVTLSGFATSWNDSAVVSFGEGITVTRTKAASPTSLLVHIRVAAAARAEVRDVQVTQGNETLRWVAAFTVLERVKFTTLGTASQMSLSVVRLEVNEPSFEFDTSGVTVKATPDLPVAVLHAASKAVDVVVFANADAGTGAYDLEVINLEGNIAERRFRAAQVLTVTGLQKTELIEGVPQNGSIDRPYQSATYRFEPSPPDAGTSNPLLLQIESSSTAVSPRVALVTSAGIWPSNVPFKPAHVVNVAPGDFVWAVVFDASGGSGFSYTLTATRMNRSLEEEPNDTLAQARAATLPAVIGPMQLGSLTDVDWVKVSASQADVGKRFHVITAPGDDYADPVVEVFSSDGTTSLGGKADDDYHEDHFSTAIPAPGDYFVKVSVSPFVTSWDPADSHYELLITVE